ncbi:hypothetical protein D1007_48555 [Hordeum vulgare]|nr:hypothetical protein D1007_48555 [Hordeum vulgare]
MQALTRDHAYYPDMESAMLTEGFTEFKEDNIAFTQKDYVRLEFFSCKAKLVDGSIQDIPRDTFVRWDVDCRDIDPQELQNMEEKVVKNLVERIGESIVWGPDQEVSLLRFDNWKGCYVRIEDGEDMMADTEWVAQKQMLLSMISELTVISEERRDDTDEEEGHNRVGTVVSIDWNHVDLEERTDLFMAPIADIKMAKLFGIPVDDRDKEKDDTSVRAGANRNSKSQDDADILKHMMEMGADDMDDADDNELVNLYDKENHVIEVGKLWPNMDEYRMCVKTYAVNHEFEAKTLWTGRKKFYARCQGYDGGANPFEPTFVIMM